MTPSGGSDGIGPTERDVERARLMASEIPSDEPRVNALSPEAHACAASEVRVGDTYIYGGHARIVTSIGRDDDELTIRWRGGEVMVSEGAEVYALWGTSR